MDGISRSIQAGPGAAGPLLPLGRTRRRRREPDRSGFGLVGALGGRHGRSGLQVQEHGSFPAIDPGPDDRAGNEEFRAHVVNVSERAMSDGAADQRPPRTAERPSRPYSTPIARTVSRRSFWAIAVAVILLFWTIRYPDIVALPIAPRRAGGHRHPLSPPDRDRSAPCDLVRHPGRPRGAARSQPALPGARRAASRAWRIGDPCPHERLHLCRLRANTSREPPRASPIGRSCSIR